MSALLQSPLDVLELDLLEEEESRFAADFALQCRFCRCTEFSPCQILVRESEGKFYLARTEAEATSITVCRWFLPGICGAPACMEKLMRELRGEMDVILFDASGKDALGEKGKKRRA